MDQSSTILTEWLQLVLWSINNARYKIWPCCIWCAITNAFEAEAKLATASKVVTKIQRLTKGYRLARTHVLSIALLCGSSIAVCRTTNFKILHIIVFIYTTLLQ